MTLCGAFRSITTTCNALHSETLRRDWIGGFKRDSCLLATVVVDAEVTDVPGVSTARHG